jgi:hypothetical protein
MQLMFKFRFSLMLAMSYILDSAHVENLRRSPTDEARDGFYLLRHLDLVCKMVLLLLKSLYYKISISMFSLAIIRR